MKPFHTLLITETGVTIGKISGLWMKTVFPKMS